MSQRALIHFLTLWAAAALGLPSCSGGNLNGMPGVVGAQSRHAAASASKSWIDPAGRTQKLLYVADSGSGTVEVYTYPNLSHAGELTGFEQPLFDCVDKAQNVWIIDYEAGTASEYAHGGTTMIGQITGLSEPYACSVNRKNGDLAIAVNVPPSVSLGEVAVYHNASGSPTIYSDSNFALISGLAYDGAGNLWVDGLSPSDAFRYAELPFGASSLTDVTLSTTPSTSGAVVWDGHYIDVGDYTNTIYQTQGATVVNTLSLNLSNDTLRGYFVSGKKVIATDAYANFVGAFRYPGGGAPKKSISSGLNTPWDVVLSK